MEIFLIDLSSAFLYALAITIAYYVVNKKKLNEEMLLTLLLLPIVVSSIIFAIGSNVAGAFSLAGIFTIVRFRSTQASPKDITYILIAVAAGLASAMGYYLGGLVLIMFSIFIILGFEFLTSKKNKQIIKILIPEDLVNDYEIEKVLQEYSSYFSLEEVSTKDLGSLFELVYLVSFLENTNYKEVFDKLRIINGNLTIKLTKNKNV